MASTTVAETQAKIHSEACTPSTMKVPAIPAAAQWNTSRLGLRLAVDGTSALCAGVLLAPIVSIIDRAIMENASGAQPSLVASVRASVDSLVRQPFSLLAGRPFQLIVLLYGSTYLSANLVDTISATVKPVRATTNADTTASAAANTGSFSQTTAGLTKFLASSTANVGICIYKDQVYVKLFGPLGAAPRPVPTAAYALFALRDCLTIAASFNVAPRLGPWLDQHMALASSSSSSLAAFAHLLPSSLHVSGQTIAQFAAPSVTQLVSTPMHLLGLDLYNRPRGTPDAPSWVDRSRAIARNWLGSTAARVCRILPAYGMGGVVNSKMRRSLMEKLERGATV